uniref:CUB domain-containing protein n=1 Tax=Panagrolaimus davidi TaxID=227884 RepID=A0A914Q940_9BILA
MSWTDSGFFYNQSQPFYSSVVDGNSFSFYDGRLYNENNKCYYYGYNGDDVNQNVTECCTSMTPINITNTNQMCTHFTSASNITNISDNSIYASMMIDYELTDSNVTMVGKFSGSPSYEPYLIVDDAEGCINILNNTIYCGYPLYPSGNKLLVFLSENFNNTQIFGFANRFIINGNLTLKSEDTAFTRSDNCQTFNNYPYDSTRNLSISTKACCETFQDLSSVSPSSVSATIPTTTSGSKSFSNFNFLTLFLSLIAAFELFKA